MTTLQHQERVELATNNFKNGMNCSQAVVTAFADLYNLPEEIALKVSSSFGGGIGRMRLTCGAACGLFMLAGLEKAGSEPNDAKARSENYKLVQDFSAEFTARCGSICCSDLLGLTPNTPVTNTPEERTAEYYKKRPCSELVAEAASIFAKYLDTKNQQ